MKYKRIINLYFILKKYFNEKEFSFEYSYYFFQLMQQLTPIVKIYFQKENHIIEQYAKGENEKGEIIFETKENQEKCLQELEFLQNEDITVNIQKIPLNLSDFKNMNILIPPFSFNYLKDIFDIQIESEEEE